MPNSTLTPHDESFGNLHHFTDVISRIFVQTFATIFLNLFFLYPVFLFLRDSGSYDQYCGSRLRKIIRLMAYHFTGRQVYVA